MGLKFKNQRYYYKVTSVEFYEEFNELFIELTKYEKANKKNVLSVVDTYVNLSEYDPELINMDNLVETAYNIIKAMDPNFNDKEVR